MNVVLHQFQGSHFNEKARWALAFKGIEHRRESYLPGPHMPAIKKLSGQSQTPVIQLQSEVITGSAQIIDRLEKDFPNAPSLYPVDTQQREEALALQAEFDQVLGPAVRTVVFAQLINQAGYLAQMFARDASRLKRFAYRATLPLAKPLIAKGNGVDDPANVEKARDTVQAYLKNIAERVLDADYMVGTSFTVADLTAAALFAPLTALDHVDMQRPQPIPEPMQTLYDTYVSQPALHWVQLMYERHRP